MTTSATIPSEPGPSVQKRQTHQPIGLFIQPACLQHRYIRHANSSHIFERPERLRAVLLGVAAGVARLEASTHTLATQDTNGQKGEGEADDLSGLLSSLSLSSSTSFQQPRHITLVPPPSAPTRPGTILLHHPAVQIVHSPVPEAPFPYLGVGSNVSGSGGIPQSTYLRDLFKWASEAVDKIKETGSEIPQGLGLNQGDLYLGPGSVLAIEGAIQTVCQAVDRVAAHPTMPVEEAKPVKQEPSTPPGQRSQPQPQTQADDDTSAESSTSARPSISKAFCVIRPPGHHCGEDAPSGFCYINNVVVAAMHAYLQHDIDRAIIIDFDLHHGNGTQALVMPLNAASHAEDLMRKAGKPSTMLGKDGRIRRGWKGFYGSVHDIYSYPCEDGDLDLVKDASLSLAAHGQYIENIHLQPYTSEEDFYKRIYPLYLALLDKARAYMEQTSAESERTIVLISAGFDACEHEHQGMQRHDRRVPTSFFSRYTKDIVDFADRYTNGKIVSVLEGGYSDRALTSAAMGHIVGMNGSLPEGCDDWWNETELLNLEKATKKKRNSKLAPFPSELSSYPHLLRTHSLLSHFENYGLPVESHSTAPSVVSTPQQTRMTLRDRRKPDEPGGLETTPPPAARRAVRGRGTVSVNSTPRQKTTTTPVTYNQSTKASTLNINVKVDVLPSLPQSQSDGALARKVGTDIIVQDVELPKEMNDVGNSIEQAVRGIQGVSLGSPVASGPEVEPIDTATAVSALPVPPASNPMIPSLPVQAASDTGSNHDATAPKIILRIPRLQSLPQSNSELYPSLPTRPEVQVRDRMAYREGSATSSNAGTGTSTDAETEYASALSGVDEAAGRSSRERTDSTGTGAGSVGSVPDMPGGYGR